MEQIRGLVFYRHYFNEFFDRQSGKVKEKIDYVLFLVTHADRIPEKFLKYIEGQKGLYEVRIECGNISFVFSVALTGGEGRFQYIISILIESILLPPKPAGSPNCYEKAGEGGPSAPNQVFFRGTQRPKNHSLASLAPQQPAVLSVPVSDSIHIPSGFVSKFFWVSFGILPVFYWEPQKNFKRTPVEMQ